MKKCSICGPKPVSDFDTNISRSDGLQTCCRNCSSVRNRERYLQNKDEIRQRAAEWNQQQHKILTTFLFGYLTSHSCVDCGNANILVLEFDHVRGVKVDAIGRMLSRRVCLEVLKVELEKCDVRCRNCHAIRTQLTNPRSWRKEVLAPNAEAGEATVCKTV